MFKESNSFSATNSTINKDKLVSLIGGATLSHGLLSIISDVKQSFYEYSIANNRNLDHDNIDSEFNQFSSKVAKEYTVLDNSKSSDKLDIVLPVQIIEDNGIICAKASTGVTKVILNTPRSNSTTLEVDTEELKIGIVRKFAMYATETFSVYFETKTCNFAIRLDAVDGQKGKVEVYVFIVNGKEVTKDLASKYLDVSEILSYCKG